MILLLLLLLLPPPPLLLLLLLLPPPPPPQPPPLPPLLLLLLLLHVSKQANAQALCARHWNRSDQDNTNIYSRYRILHTTTMTTTQHKI